MPVVPDIRNRITKKHPKAFSHHEEVIIQTSRWSKSWIPRLKEAKCSREHALSLITIMVVCRKSLESIGYLCEQGLASEAIPLARKLIEGYINAKYIRLDPENRARLFNLSPLVTSVVREETLWRLRGANEAEMHYQGAAQSDYTRNVDMLISEVVPLIGKSHGEFSDLVKLSREWSNVGLRDRAVAVDRGCKSVGIESPFLEIRYESEYRQMCEFSHGAGSNLERITETRESSVDFHARRTDAYVPNVLIIGTKWFLWLLHELAQSLSGEMGVELYDSIVKPNEEVNRILAEEYEMTMELG